MINIGKIPLRKNIALFLIFAFICSFSLFGYTISVSLFATTEKDKEIELSDLRYGHFLMTEKGEKITIGKDSHGNPISRTENARFVFSEGYEIPLVVDSSFGFKFWLPQLDRSDSLQLRISSELPASVFVNGKETDMIEGNYLFNPETSSEEKSVYWTFEEKNQKYFIPGIWKFSLYNKGNLLISQEFEIYEVEIEDNE